ncbi:protein MICRORCHIDIA 2-like isoform X2 [Phalaenopsis equestris]|uniref:protein MICRORCHIDIA 2-like isoform X2 n=1 Tax=Phalaenopsis equestris TaxID=78828 RepID=UPI0009E45CDD|nr:protein MICRORCHIDIA 2-like isoform X2 [Phalaenopsis equestris]
MVPAALGGKSSEPLVAARNCETLECRSFWRAGNYEVKSSLLPSLQESCEFDRARVHPKFLHSNATSHKWAFGAIAELLDNAVDEICNGATFVKVDKMINPRDSSPMLLVQDDGGGMDPEGIRHCMSLGFSKKNSKTTIGQYGNGFKTSTMRLGADAIVFTRANHGCNETQSIGLLSYTFLRRTMKDDIIVPMLDFGSSVKQMQPLVYSSQDDWDDSLRIILDWSPFSSEEQLLQQFEDVGTHGTKVLIYNLWMNDTGLLELDFDDDDEDIRLRDRSSSEGFSRFHKEVVQMHISYTLRYSLRAYSSILYLRTLKNFQIILRGKPVEQIKIADELKFSKSITYKPQTVASEDAVARTTIGFAKEAPVLGIFGVNVYHKNRLIMPFWKVLQEGSSRGRCVVGIIEANFIEPAHDKQDFERTPLFIRLETKLRQLIIEYWKGHCHLIGYQPITPEVGDKHRDAIKHSRILGKSTQQKPGGHGIAHEKSNGEKIVALPTLNGSSAASFVQAPADSLMEDAFNFGQVRAAPA